MIFLLIAGLAVTGIWWFGNFSAVDRRSPVQSGSTSYHERGSGEASKRKRGDVADLENLVLYRPVELPDLLKSDENPAALLNRIGGILRSDIEVHGDYHRVGLVLKSLPPQSSRSLMMTWVIGSASKRGAIEDYFGQKEVAGACGWSKDVHIMAQLTSKTGGRAAAELVERRAEMKLPAGELREIVRGGIAEKGVSTGFQIAESLSGSDAPDDIAALEMAVDQLLIQDATRTSELLGKVAAGEGRDRICRRMIRWLHGKGDASAAAMWMKTLPDSEENSKFKAEFPALQ